jgi:phenylpropionate dioxygenase-like ring-hydroxylating dioxygenase large terminal subunit
MTIAVPTWTKADQEAGYSLPAPFFYDPAVYEDEKREIFLKSWHLVGHLNDFRETGDIVVETLLDQSVLVMKGSDGQIRAFHNVCQHRGNRLVETRRSKARAITCGYHAWTYGLDGSLRGAPRTECLTHFDKTEHGLKPVRAEVFGSFVFVNLDPAARAPRPRCGAS